MWKLLQALLMKLAVFRILRKLLASLGFLLPLALLLKAIGWPVLLVLGALAIPIVVVLAIFGLPLLAIVVVGGGFLSIIFGMLTWGLMILKMLLPFIVIVLVVKWLFKWGSGGDKGDKRDPTPPPPPPFPMDPPPPPPPPHAGSATI